NNGANASRSSRVAREQMAWVSCAMLDMQALPVRSARHHAHALRGRASTAAQQGPSPHSPWSCTHFWYCARLMVLAWPLAYRKSLSSGGYAAASSWLMRPSWLVSNDWNDGGGP